MSEPWVFHVQAFGCTVQFEAETRNILEPIEPYILPGLKRTHAPALSPDLVIGLFQDARGVQLKVNDAAVASANDPIGLVIDITDAIDDVLIKRLDGSYAVHAGAVLLEGRALLLPGATHAGKSSLVTELLRSGAQCFSDEYALVDTEGRVRSYPRPMLVRNGTKRQSPALPADFGSSTASAPAPVGWILALEYQPIRSWGVSQVPQSMAMLSLLQNTPHALADAPNMVSCFERAVSCARCYAGHRAEAKEAVREILDLVRSS